MASRRRRPARTRRRTLVLPILVGALVVLLAIAAVSTWIARGGPAPAAALQPGDAPIPSVDPRVVATELVGLAPELTPASAEMLARALPGASGAPLAETGLLFASRGFDLMERADLLEMGNLVNEVYATLPPPDREWMGEYMRMLREGSLTAEASVRGRQLLTQGVNLMPAERRARLQALMEKAIAAALEARRREEGRTPPPPLAVVAMPPFVPMPPNSPPAEPAAMVPSPKGSPSPAHDETYWRSRMKDARERVASLEQKVDELDRITRQNLGATSKRAAELAKAREELAAAERALEELEEEARRAGALPGWLRE
jgi:hypothetical protein